MRFRRTGVIASTITLVLVGLTVLGFQLVRPAQPKLSTAPKPVAIPRKTVAAAAGMPIRIRIPAIKTNAELEYVALDSLGQLESPKKPNNAAWYDRGVRPGEIGSAVIDGHYGWKDNLPAVFDDLHSVAKGDKVFVDDEKGTTTTFVVRDIRTYPEDHTGKEIFSSDDKRAHLNLITCHGAWNTNQQSYPNRLVVFADKV